jgi:hypothetical protein
MIKLNQLLKEETFTATNKATGKTSVFKTKDSRDAAIKAGTHTSKDDKTQSEPKVAGGDMFGGDYAKDRGGEAPKADAGKSKTTTTPTKSQYDDPTYWKDSKKYYDEEDDVEKTSDRLDKVEKALETDLDLRGNGFETTRESGGGQGGWEGPMTIIDKNSDYDTGYNCLSIGSGENDGKFSIGFYNQDGEPVFDDEDYGSLTGDKVLSAKQTYKIGKALMAMPEVQKFIKGEITSDEFAAVHDKIKSKLNKTTNEGIIRLTNLLKEGLGPDNAMVAAISDALKKELGVDNVKVKKYNQGRARQGYDFYPDGTKGGLYIDEAYDGTWNIYTTKANGFPNHNHWEISSFPVDIEDKQTALKAALAVIKKFKKDLQ